MKESTLVFWKSIYEEHKFVLRCYWYITWSKIICNRIIEDQVHFFGGRGDFTLSFTLILTVTVQALMFSSVRAWSVDFRSTKITAFRAAKTWLESVNVHDVCGMYCPRISQRKMCSFAFVMKLSLFLISWPNLLHYLPHPAPALKKALQPIFPTCRTPILLHRCTPPYAHLVILTAWNNLQNIGRYTRTLLHSNVVGWRMG